VVFLFPGCILNLERKHGVLIHWKNPFFVVKSAHILTSLKGVALLYQNALSAEVLMIFDRK
jgi:hypothetical protein